MKTKTAVRKIFTLILAGGATLAIGFLSFAGMFLLSSSFILCTGAFILAAAYEGQVNSESISKGLQRLFDPHYLKYHLLIQYLDELAQQQNSTNLFIANYCLQKKIQDDLQKEIHHLHHLKDKTRAQQRELKSLLAQIKSAKSRVKKIQYAFITAFELKRKNEHTDNCSPEINKLLANDFTRLNNEIRRKQWIIRLGALFAAGGGISCGLATYSAIQIGVAAFAILSVVPGGVLVSLAVIAAIGYSFLLYQSIAEMVQEYNDNWKTYFQQREKESKTKHILRCIGITIAIGLGIFATLATAGTWWLAVKNGAQLLNIAANVASAIRSISVAMMAMPSFIFSASNSVKSVNDISKSSYSKLVNDIFSNIKNTWKKENPMQFFNLFRFAEKILSNGAKGILFIGHVTSMGLTADRFSVVAPTISIPANALSELLTDLPFLPDENKQHNHSSKLLTLLFLPVTLTAFILKCVATLWDWGSSSLWAIFNEQYASFAVSRDNIFYPEKKVIPAATELQAININKPQLKLNLTNKLTQLNSQSNTTSNPRLSPADEKQALLSEYSGTLFSNSNKDNSSSENTPLSPTHRRRSSSN